ncbi:MarR family winged helix-turn-helix transcriptional regulator [Martelella mangrovi]|uniref:MarR family transcriptional regulator for hemolysin n=1 Tax=Martelella mangrovi TaxID=1397477 RepID=A0ABV2IEM0_9HYPH
MSAQIDNRHVAFMENLTVASRKMRTYYNARVARYGLTFARARVILLLSKNETMNQSELACELELEKPTVVRLLDRMEAHGFIERRADPNDRRAKLIALSAHGTDMARELDIMRAEFYEAVLGPVGPDELLIATTVFETIIAKVDQIIQDRPDD